MPISVPVFRVFVSSTFGDLEAERSALHERVFEPLRAMCASHDAEFQAIDLRWGVSEAAGTDRQTLRICFDELERCRPLSPDCYLLILLGYRYGSYILPPELLDELGAHLLARLGRKEKRSFAPAYRLD